MANQSSLERIRIASLTDLDALVGTRLTGETPVTHWEDGHTLFVFSSVEEALESLQDPYYQHFKPLDPNAPRVLREIKEFRRYSTDLSAAWDVVETVSSPVAPLQVACEADRWVASFGKGPAVVAESAPVAICMAALQARGIAVEFVEEGEAAARSPAEMRPKP
jgi:hypothetical protein